MDEQQVKNFTHSIAYTPTGRTVIAKNKDVADAVYKMEGNPYPLTDKILKQILGPIFEMFKRDAPNGKIEHCMEQCLEVLADNPRAFIKCANSLVRCRGIISVTWIGDDTPVLEEVSESLVRYLNYINGCSAARQEFLEACTEIAGRKIINTSDVIDLFREKEWLTFGETNELFNMYFQDIPEAVHLCVLNCMQSGNFDDYRHMLKLTDTEATVRIVDDVSACYWFANLLVDYAVKAQDISNLQYLVNNPHANTIDDSKINSIISVLEDAALELSEAKRYIQVVRAAFFSSKVKKIAIALQATGVAEKLFKERNIAALLGKYTMEKWVPLFLPKTTAVCEDPQDIAALVEILEAIGKKTPVAYAYAAQQLIEDGKEGICLNTLDKLFPILGSTVFEIQPNFKEYMKQVMLLMKQKGLKQASGQLKELRVFDELFLYCNFNGLAETYTFEAWKSLLFSESAVIPKEELVAYSRIAKSLEPYVAEKFADVLSQVAIRNAGVNRKEVLAAFGNTYRRFALDTHKPFEQYAVTILNAIRDYGAVYVCEVLDNNNIYERVFDPNTLAGVVSEYPRNKWNILFEKQRPIKEEKSDLIEFYDNLSPERQAECYRIWGGIIDTARRDGLDAEHYNITIEDVKESIGLRED